jgi:integrase/recombinase XerD
VSRTNIVKRIRIDGKWKMVSIPRNDKGNYDWNALPEGRYYVEWYMGGTRRRQGAGVTAAQALEAQRRKRHELEGRKLGVPGFEKAGERSPKAALHIAIKKYLEQIDALKKANTYRKYEAVLKRFGDFFRDYATIEAISNDDLTRFVVALKRDHKLAANSIIHNAVIVAQFLKHHGRNNVLKEMQLPEPIISLPKEYREEELARFFDACYDSERSLFSTFLLTGFREQEVMYLFWSDVNPQLRTIRVTSKPDLGFYPKRWEERQIPAPAELLAELARHPRRPNSQFVFPSPTGNREQHMLDRCKAVAKRAGLDPTKFDLKTFRSTYATRMLRQGFDVRTVQHWMGHKSLETTMRYLVPASDVHMKLDQVKIPAISKRGAAAKTLPKGEAPPSRRGRPKKTFVPAATAEAPLQAAS